VVAVLVLILGLVSINSGLTLIGSPLSVSNWFVLAPQAQTSAPVGAADTLILNAQNDGYSPAVLAAKAGTPITLKLVTEDTRSCARAFVIPSLGVEEFLPQSGTVEVSIPSQPAGTVIPFSCSMGMYSGKIEFHD
jgi:uncharacterized protein